MFTLTNFGNSNLLHPFKYSYSNDEIKYYFNDDDDIFDVKKYLDPIFLNNKSFYNIYENHSYTDGYGDDDSDDIDYVHEAYGIIRCIILSHDKQYIFNFCEEYTEWDDKYFTSVRISPTRYIYENIKNYRPDIKKILTTLQYLCIMTLFKRNKEDNNRENNERFNKIMKKMPKIVIDNYINDLFLN